MSPFEEVSADDLEAVLGSESHPVVVDFWSPWCAPCRTLRPHLERLALEHASKARFIAVNIGTGEDVATRFGVRSLPTVAIYRDGVRARCFNGAALLGSFEGALKELAHRSSAS